MKQLAFVNWVVLGLGALLTLLYAVVCLMMLPYPQLVANAGGDFAHVLQITLGLAGFSLVAAVATWLVQTRRALWWAGQAAMLVALAALVALVWTTRT